METGMLHLHSLLRWIILVLLLVSIVKAYTGWKQGRAFTAGDRRIWSFTMIAAHTTFAVGLYLLLAGKLAITNGVPAGESVMSNRTLRFFWVEHPVMMFISIILITLAAGKAKKAIPDLAKFKHAFWLFLVALILILVSIPWPFREIGANRAWFPGM